MFNDTQVKIKFQFINSEAKPIFGAEACTAMAVVKRVHGIKLHDTSNDIYDKFKDNLEVWGVYQANTQ